MPQDDKALLLRLKKHEVEFVIIGGVCSSLHGASLVTLDLDICCKFVPANLYRLESAVKDLHPRHRLTTQKLPLELTDELIPRLRNIYLTTDLGVLDCLGEVTGVGDYEQVFQHSIVHNGSYGEVRILSIDALISAKKAVGRERDLAAVTMLEAIREKNQRQGNLF